MASSTTDPASIEANATARATAADARGKRPVWNVPPNGAIETGSVMDAVSWPALSDSAKASPKSSSSDSLKSLSDGSVSGSAPPGPLMSSPSSKPADSSTNPNPTQNPMSPARQKSIKGGNGGGSGSSSGGSGNSTPVNGGAGPTLLPSALMELAQSVPEEQSPRGSRTGGLSPQPHGAGNQHRSYGGNRRGNGGGGSHQNHGSRRDQEWNHHRNAHMQHRGSSGGIRSYPRPPPTISVPFIGPPPPGQPFAGNAVGFPDVLPPLYLVTPQPFPESLRGMPFVPHPVPPLSSPSMDPQRAQLLKQIDYYFSSDNLCKDIFLRQNMDEQGWVPISLIAGFNRVKQITNNIPYILDTVRSLSTIEVQGDRIRRKLDWRNWLLQPANHFGSASGSQSPTVSDYDAVATRLQNIGLNGTSVNQNGLPGTIPADIVFTRSASGNLNNQFQVVGDRGQEGSTQFTSFIDPDRSRSSRSLSRSDTL